MNFFVGLLSHFFGGPKRPFTAHPHTSRGCSLPHRYCRWAVARMGILSIAEAVLLAVWPYQPSKDLGPPDERDAPAAPFALALPVHLAARLWGDKHH